MSVNLAFNTLRIFALALLVTGCAATGVNSLKQHPTLARKIELTKTPFFPQEDYQCGPAALATALNAVAIKVSPETLKSQVYIPSRKGSLQVEMLAAARRHGALVIQTPPTLTAVMHEIAAGNVVLVLQNLGLSFAPSWHYAVVVGYDLDRELVWLRSGTYERFEMSLSAFERTWARSQHWAFVALVPGQLSASAGVEETAKALINFEKNAKPALSQAAYSAAVKRWPEHLVLLMGLANNAYQTGDLKLAQQTLEFAAIKHPTSAAVHNNLSSVLLAQGNQLAALTHAQKAVELIAQDPNASPALQTQIQQTLQEAKLAANKH